jgi:predicted glycosyltransferase involved in capsule biosynthesis
MSLISLLIPFRNTGDREKQYHWLQEKWNTLLPEAEIIVSEDDGNDPFSKTMAVNNAYKKSSSDFLALIDADCWLEPKILLDSVEKIKNGDAIWVNPTKQVYRLNKKTTFDILEGRDYNFNNITIEETERTSLNVGAASVFTREQFEFIGGMDQRFRGWGGEDNAFNSIINTLFGKPIILDNIIYHLWHPRDRNENGKAIWKNQENSNQIFNIEYNKANNNKDLMLKIAEENRKRTKIGITKENKW